jgi:hypothetical protein
MVSIRDQRLSVPDKTGSKVTLRVRFTLRQNETECSLFPALRWQCNIHFFAVDSDKITPIRIPPTLLFNATSERDTTHSFDFSFNRSELDEDPWWQFLNTEDEIKARISIFPFFQGVTDSTSEYTNTIQEQFG